LGWTLRGLGRAPKTYASAPVRKRGKPLARSEELVVEELGDELLVYDETSHRAHCLGSTAARVWRACDGETTVDALSARLDLDREMVARALDELRECELLEGESGAAHVGNGMTRRDLTFRAAKVGAAAAAAPLIWSVTAPLPAAAQTPSPEQCQEYNNKSCSGCCKIQGCCCCCEGGGNCKLCFPTGLCSPTHTNCEGTGRTPHCSCRGGEFPPGTPCADVSNDPQCCGCTYPSNC
jgi:hypothetical protein